MGHWAGCESLEEKKKVVGKGENSTSPEVKWESLSDERGKGECRMGGFGSRPT